LFLAGCGSTSGDAIQTDGGAHGSGGVDSQVDRSARGGKTAADLGVDLASPLSYPAETGACAAGVEFGVVVDGMSGKEMCVGVGSVPGEGPGTMVLVGASGTTSGGILIDDCSVKAAASMVKFNVLPSDEGQLLVGNTTPNVKSVAVEAAGGGNAIVLATFPVPGVEGLAFYATPLPPGWEPGMVQMFDNDGAPMVPSGALPIEGCWR
jgi:hypothetical protein